MPSVFSRRPVPLATTVCGVTDSLPFLIVPDSLSGLGQGLPPSAVRHYCSSFYLFFYFLLFSFLLPDASDRQDQHGAPDLVRQ